MKTDLGDLSSTPIGRDRELLRAAWAVSAAFGCYFCMYAFRKPFTAGSYANTTLWGLGFKTVLVAMQVAGYMISKVIGIRIVSEMPPRRRAFTLLLLVVIAEVALVLFGVLPRPWNAICLFFNGLPLGMIFGLVLGFLEGRRLTELLTAGLCASFILADGVTKTVGAWLLRNGVGEDWMPSVAGVLFLLPFAVFVAMLARIPSPSHYDIAARSERTPMTRPERARFVRRYAMGLVPLLLMYLATTIVRSIRADFAPELWTALGTPAQPSTFTNSELLVALGVVAANGAAVFIRDNRHAFFLALATCGLGFCLLTGALLAQQSKMISAFGFMVVVGLGLYLPYVATHTTIFERLIGMTRERGNIGFLMTLADSVGYLGYVAVMIVRNFVPTTGNVLSLLIIAGWATVCLSAVSLAISWRYFARLEQPAGPLKPAIEGLA